MGLNNVIARVIYADFELLRYDLGLSGQKESDLLIIMVSLENKIRIAIEHFRFPKLLLIFWGNIEIKLGHFGQN